MEREALEKFSFRRSVRLQADVAEVRLKPDPTYCTVLESL